MKWMAAVMVLVLSAPVIAGMLGVLLGVASFFYHLTYSVLYLTLIG